MAQAQTSGKSAKTQAPKAPKAARKVPAGTLEKKAKPIEEQPAPEAAAQPAFEERREGDRRANELAAGDRVMAMMAQPKEPPVDMVAFQAEMAKLAEKYGVPAAAVQVKQKAVRAAKHQQNGVTRPAAETTCGKIWALADAISQQTGTIATISCIRAHESMRTVNDHTIKTQYARWRQYNNISGRLPRIHVVQQQQGEYAGLPAMTPPAVPAVQAAPETDAHTDE